MLSFEAPVIEYGAGLDVDEIVLGTVRRDMQAGTYEIDEAARAEVVTALAAISDPDVPDPSTDELKHTMHLTPNKELRNAMTSFAIERAWEPYADLVLAGGFYAVAFDDGGRSSLQPVRGHEDLSASEIVTLIGATNQDVLTHFICKQFEDDEPLVISGDKDRDAAYYEAYKEQTLLDIYATSNFRTIPLNAGPPSVFTTSGTVGLRTHIFGIPNLIDTRAGARGFRLSNAMHRRSFIETMQRVTARQYKLTTTVAIAASLPLANDERNGLDPEKWSDNGDPDNFLVYPSHEWINDANARLRAREQELAAQDPPEKLPAVSGCPAAHGRVEVFATAGKVIPIPRSLLNIALGQLDQHYYTRRVE